MDAPDPPRDDPRPANEPVAAEPALTPAPLESEPQVEEPAPPPPLKPRKPGFLEERPEPVFEVPSREVQRQSRRDFLLLGLGTAAALTGMWWLMPDRARSRF